MKKGDKIRITRTGLWNRPDLGKELTVQCETLDGYAVVVEEGDSVCRIFQIHEFIPIIKESELKEVMDEKKKREDLAEAILSEMDDWVRFASSGRSIDVDQFWKSMGEVYRDNL